MWTVIGVVVKEEVFFSPHLKDDSMVGRWGDMQEERVPLFCCSVTKHHVTV